MHDYHQVIFRMGQSDRIIVKTGLMSRTGCAESGVIAQKNGRMNPVRLTDNDVWASSSKTRPKSLSQHLSTGMQKCTRKGNERCASLASLIQATTKSLAAFLLGQSYS
jgi:hypothetical protein